MREAIASGAGVEKFREIIAWQGGDPAVVDDYRRLPQAAQRHTVRASRGGFVASIDAMPVARAAMALGAGRDRVDAVIDPAVGVTLAVARGDEVRVNDPLFELHYNDAGQLFEAIRLVNESLTLAEAPPAAAPIVLDEVR